MSVIHTVHIAKMLQKNPNGKKIYYPTLTACTCCKLCTLRLMCTKFSLMRLVKYSVFGVIFSSSKILFHKRSLAPILVASSQYSDNQKRSAKGDFRENQVTQRKKDLQWSMYIFPKLSLGKKPICSAPSGHPDKANTKLKMRLLPRRN